MPSPPEWRKLYSWRRGLRWDKQAKKWRDIEKDRLLTDRELRRRKLFAQRADETRGADAKQIREGMRSGFSDAVFALREQGYSVDSRTKVNKDGSIDGELRIKPKRGQSTNEAQIDMEASLEPVAGVWVSSGVRYAPQRGDTYDKYQGMAQAQTYYSRMFPQDYASNMVGGREINELMNKRRNRKAEQVFIRLHWNPEDAQPDFPERREKGQKGYRRKRKK